MFKKWMQGPATIVDFLLVVGGGMILLIAFAYFAFLRTLH